MVFLDQEKAYDRVRQVWLGKVLDQIGVPPRFSASMLRLLESSRAALMCNGYCGRTFALGRGVPQGDPLSPILYALLLEPLMDRICQKVAGISIYDIVWKVGAFADDMVVGLGSVADVGAL